VFALFSLAELGDNCLADQVMGKSIPGGHLAVKGSQQSVAQAEINGRYRFFLAAPAALAQLVGRGRGV